MKINNDFFRTLNFNNADKENITRICNARAIVSLILGLAATAMLIMN